MAEPSGLSSIELQDRLDFIKHLLAVESQHGAGYMVDELKRLKEQYEEEQFEANRCKWCGQPGGH